MTRLISTLPVLLLALGSCTTPSPKETATSAPEKFIAESADVYVTARDTSLCLSPTGEVKFHKTDQPGKTQVCVFVNPLITFQTMVGIGGAITDAAAETFAKLPENTQKELITAYYDTDEGIGYNFARTNIDSCDFSSGTYNYVEDHDSLPRTFSIYAVSKVKI